MNTAYDQSVGAAKEVYRKEAREREMREYLEKEQNTHKKAARIWFNALTEVWPPENTEAYWTKTSEKMNRLWNENMDNELLHELLLMTLSYLGNVSGNAETVQENRKSIGGKHKNEIL